MKEVDVGAGIIFRKINGTREILLIQRDKKDHWPLFWEYPRGKCKNNEKIKECAKREIKEETGLNVKIIKFIDEFVYQSEKKKSTQFNFLCLVDSNSEVKLSFEHQDYKWISSLAIAKLYLTSEMYKILEKSEILKYSDKESEIDEIIEENIKYILK